MRNTRELGAWRRVEGMGGGGGGGVGVGYGLHEAWKLVILSWPSSLLFSSLRNHTPSHTTLTITITINTPSAPHRTSSQISSSPPPILIPTLLLPTPPPLPSLPSLHPSPRTSAPANTTVTTSASSTANPRPLATNGSPPSNTPPTSCPSRTTT